MINLVDIVNPDDQIRAELTLANIPVVNLGMKIISEVPSTLLGSLGDWRFRRKSDHWIATVRSGINGLRLTEARKLFYTKHPDNEFLFLGDCIRAGDVENTNDPVIKGALPTNRAELEKQVKALPGYENEDMHEMSVARFDKLFKAGQITEDHYVDVYCITSQTGLNEFAKFITKN